MSRIAWISVIAVAVSTASAGADMHGNASGDAGRAGLTLSAAAYVPTAAASSAQLVTSIASPCTGSGGLTWDGTYLWVADYDTRRAYQVDPTTGVVVRSIHVPGKYPNGLAWDGSALWYAETDRSKIYKLNPYDGRVLQSFAAPGLRPGGLDFDGLDLWCCVPGTGMEEGTVDKIYRITTGGTVLASFGPIGGFPTGLAFDGQFLWHSDNAKDMIYKLNPADLSVVDSFPAPGTYPNGLAWDGRYLWVAENDTDRLYKYDVGTPAGAALKPSVLVCGAAQEEWLADVRQKLVRTMRFAKVDVLGVRDATPTLAQLQGYDAVLVFSGAPGYQDPNAMGNVMADYVDAGGGVVCMMFEVAITSPLEDRTMLGRWNAGKYYAIPRGEQEMFDPCATLGQVHHPEHPIMRGVTTFDGGLQSYRPASLDIAPGSVRVADWSDGRPLVVTKLIGSRRRADLGFFPVSSDAREDLWMASTDGAWLMANALTWVDQLAGPAAAAVPFEDTFASKTLDAAKWTKVMGAAVDNVGIAEPSGPYSLRLNGNPWSGDSVESRMIDLSACTRAILTYSYQRTGGGESPDETEDLIVEYHDGSNWVEVDRQPGSGPDMTVFTTRAIILPPRALHAAFRLRIRSIGTTDRTYLYDDWFVDDVKMEVVTLDLPSAPVTIHFDDVWAPCAFADTNRLTDRYATLGVTFEGPDANDGGAILNECGGFAVTGHSKPNFLAFNAGAKLKDGGLPVGPEILTFSPAVSNVVISAAYGTGTVGELSLEAFDAQERAVDAATITLTSQLTPVAVSAPGIVRIVISSTADIFVLDDLSFSQGALVTSGRRRGDTLRIQQQEDTGRDSGLINGVLVPDADQP